MNSDKVDYFLKVGAKFQRGAKINWAHVASCVTHNRPLIRKDHRNSKWKISSFDSPVLILALRDVDGAVWWKCGCVVDVAEYQVIGFDCRLDDWPPVRTCVPFIQRHRYKLRRQNHASVASRRIANHNLLSDVQSHGCLRYSWVREGVGARSSIVAARIKRTALGSSKQWLWKNIFIKQKAWSESKPTLLLCVKL